MMIQALPFITVGTVADREREKKRSVDCRLFDTAMTPRHDSKLVPGEKRRE
jgi:hypothetical protein